MTFRAKSGIVLLTMLLLLGGVAFAEDGAAPEIAPEDSGETYFSFTEPGEEAGESSPDAGDDGEAESVMGVRTELSWTYPIAREILEDADDVIVLTNKETLLDSDYPPEDALHGMIDATVKKTKNQEMLARTVANEALVRMFSDASEDGAALLLHSAYRSYRTQAIMHENRLKRIGRDDGVVQLPGASDHQTGLGFDVINAAWAKEERLSRGFADTKEAQWMAENCHRYGFIIRYLDGKEDITGIMYEPWHLRYVGTEVATYMKENNLTLEEFTEEYQQAIRDYDSAIESGVIVDSFSF